jgi:hypothetical protein
MSIAVTTRSFDGCRSGSNLGETVLTRAAVRQRGLVRVARLACRLSSRAGPWPTARCTTC